MSSNKRVFTLRLSDEVFDKIGILATRDHRSITNYIEYVLLKHLEEAGSGIWQTMEKGQISVCEGRTGWEVSFPYEEGK